MTVCIPCDLQSFFVDKPDVSVLTHRRVTLLAAQFPSADSLNLQLCIHRRYPHDKP
jgi:hypothetical protein